MEETPETIIAIKNEERHDPIRGDEIPDIYVKRKVYHLSHEKFSILTTNDIKSKLLNAARWVLGPTIGFAIMLIAKLPKNANEIKPWEFFSIAIGLVGSATLYCLSRKKPNPKKDLINLITDYFRKHEEQLWVEPK
jgi:hypothetical protein